MQRMGVKATNVEKWESESIGSSSMYLEVAILLCSMIIKTDASESLFVLLMFHWSIILKNETPPVFGNFANLKKNYVKEISKRLLLF